MYLLEVFETSIYGNKHTCKRRISDNPGKLVDWFLEWAMGRYIIPMEFDCNDYGGNYGRYEYTISKIGVI